MPVAVLWVEGKVDTEVLSWVVDGAVPQQGGSREDLKRRLLDWGKKNRPRKPGHYLLQDRDFRIEPEVGRTEPYEVKQGSDLLGWHWCRHDIESYLLEVELLSVALNKELSVVRGALESAAAEIRYYVAARWVVGTLRPNVPPSFDLETKPRKHADYQLPKNLDRAAQQGWCREHIEAFRTDSAAALSKERVEEQLERHFGFFTSDALRSLETIAYWFPGKNLLPAFAKKFNLSAVDLIFNRLVPALTKDPSLLANLPEIQNLRRRLRES